MNEFKAVIFDIDGTLTEETSWTALTRDLGGSAEKHKALFDDFRNRKIGYGEAKEKLLEMWMKTGNATWAHIDQVFASWPMKPEAEAVIKEIQKRGLDICLISGSLDVYTEHVAERLKINDYYFNARLHFDANGNLTNFEYEPDQAGKKREQLEDYAKHKDLELSECLVVGDSSNDLEMFKATGRGALIEGPGTTEELKAAAWKVVSSLSEIPKLLA